MIKKCLAICIFLVAAVPNVYDQSRSKRVRQPREVVEAFRVCKQFRTLLAEDLDFDRAFEATYVKDPARRREIANADSELVQFDTSQVDSDTLIDVYKNRVQLLILMLPTVLAGGEDAEPELFPPSIAAIFKRKPPDDPQKLQAYAAQLKRDVTDFRAHVEKVATKNPRLAKNIEEYKSHLLRPRELPNRVVKPQTAYSKGNVMPPEAKYYQIDDCAVIREGGQMRLVGYTFFSLRW